MAKPDRGPGCPHSGDVKFASLKTMVERWSSIAAEAIRILTRCRPSEETPHPLHSRLPGGLSRPSRAFAEFGFVRHVTSATASATGKYPRIQNFSPCRDVHDQSLADCNERAVAPSFIDMNSPVPFFELMPALDPLAACIFDLSCQKSVELRVLHINQRIIICPSPTCIKKESAICTVQTVDSGADQRSYSSGRAKQYSLAAGRHW